MSMESVPKNPCADGFTRRTFVKAVGATLMTPLVKPAFADESTDSSAQTKVDFNPESIKAIVFDTVGTLVDSYGTITKRGAQFTQARGIQVDWFKLLDQWRAEWRRELDQVMAGTVAWRSNDVIYRDALDKVLASYEWGARLNAADRDQLNELWFELEPWPDTRPGLERLRKRYTLSTLSNGSMASVVQIVKHGKLPFDCILTAELVKSAKPDPKVYALATSSFQLRPDQILLVAAHKYDLAAARKFGFHVGFLPRPLELGPHGKVDLKPEAFYDLTQPSLVRIAEVLGA